jgi:uncharacterized circularly permuted ATP-grasp superfamily protein/uncharacterized alpha-E superfamily protein
MGPVMMHKRGSEAPWHEVFASEGTPRPLYSSVFAQLQTLTPSALRILEDRMGAILREMGLMFNPGRGEARGAQPWTCDLLPQLFDGHEWDVVVRGVQQRLRAWEALLDDVYSRREILRAGVLPVQAVLGSPNYRHASSGLPRPQNAYFHLSGICLARDRKGVLQIKQHHFAHASGLSYMLQNRRAMARVLPELFQDLPVQSIAETPVLILEQLREAAQQCDKEPRVVLLSGGEGTAAFSEQSFLVRRMGIPMVQGGDLLVLDDRLFLKTVRGLEPVHVIYNCVPDAWVDPLVFERGSALGVPGLVHCLRKRSVALVNAVGSQLADDRNLLAFASKIIRFYLAESPILPTTTTLWLGDLDQCELALENLEAWRVRRVYREWGSDHEADIPANLELLRKEVRKRPAAYIAQPRDEGAMTICFERGRVHQYPADHIVFALRHGSNFEVLPGALTRVHSHPGASGEFGKDWTSKDTWVLMESARLIHVARTAQPIELTTPSRPVTSRVAESFYWMGRYLERAHHQAYLISVVETLETEELNSAERHHYRPMWNRLLPPLEKSAGSSRRSISNRVDRYRLVLLSEPGSLFRTFSRALSNAEAVQDHISPEAWASLNELNTIFQRTRFRQRISEPAAARITRRIAAAATRIIPQFFAVAADTMLADDGWRFCVVGKMLERAIITANAVVSISGSLQADKPDSPRTSAEIELSAFLRLLGTRDAYRRIYQTRAEPIRVLELLWQHPQVPRSVRLCLEKCRTLLQQSTAPDAPGAAETIDALDRLITTVRDLDWSSFVAAAPDEDRPETDHPAPAHRPPLEPLLRSLLSDTMRLHTLLADSFLNHQAGISQVAALLSPT